MTLPPASMAGRRAQFFELVQDFPGGLA